MLTAFLRCFLALALALAICAPASALPTASTAGIYSGLVGSVTGQHATTGAISATVSSGNVLTGSITLGGKRYVIGATTVGNNGWSGQAKTGGQSLNFQFALDPTGGMHLQGTVTAAFLAGSLPVTAYPNPYSLAPGRNAPQAGSYTFIMPPPSGAAASFPQGIGYGKVTITPAGAATFTCTLADGTVTTTATTFSADGRLPFYISLYGGAGSAFGWLQFADIIGQSDLEGDVRWSKPANAASPTFPNGFAGHFTLQASRYTVPKTGRRAVELPGLSSVSISGGSLADAQQENIALDLKNIVRVLPPNPSALELTLKPLTGDIAGVFKGKAGEGRQTFRGVVYQKSPMLAGLFTRGTKTGAVVAKSQPPVAPVQLTATVLPSGVIRLEWSESLYQSGFYIGRSTNGGFSGPLAILNKPGATSYYDTTAVPGETYVYEVVPFNDAGISGTATSGAVSLATPVDSFSLPVASSRAFRILNLGSSSVQQAHTKVRFYDSTGYSMTVPAVSENPLQVAVPVYLDVNSGALSSGAVSVQVLRDGKAPANLSGKLTILASPLTPPAVPGQLTVAFLRGVAQFVDESGQAAAALVSDPAAQKQLINEAQQQKADLLTAVDALDKYVRNTGVPAPSAGNIQDSSGNSISLPLNVDALIVSDAILGELLTSIRAGTTAAGTPAVSAAPPLAGPAPAPGDPDPDAEEIRREAGEFAVFFRQVQRDVVESGRQIASAGAMGLIGSVLLAPLIAPEAAVALASISAFALVTPTLVTAANYIALRLGTDVIARQPVDDDPAPEAHQGINQENDLQQNWNSSQTMGNGITRVGTALENLETRLTNFGDSLTNRVIDAFGGTPLAGEDGTRYVPVEVDPASETTLPGEVEIRFGPLPRPLPPGRFVNQGGLLIYVPDPVNSDPGHLRYRTRLFSNRSWTEHIAVYYPQPEDTSGPPRPPGFYYFPVNAAPATSEDGKYVSLISEGSSLYGVGYQVNVRTTNLADGYHNFTWNFYNIPPAGQKRRVVARLHVAVMVDNAIYKGAISGSTGNGCGGSSALSGQVRLQLSVASKSVLGSGSDVKQVDSPRPCFNNFDFYISGFVGDLDGSTITFDTLKIGVAKGTLSGDGRTINGLWTLPKGSFKFNLNWVDE